MNCPACGTHNQANASFCIECGEPLELNNAPAVIGIGGGPTSTHDSAAFATPAAQAAPVRGPFGDAPDRAAADGLPFPASMIGWIPRPFNPLYWGWEIRLTLLVLLAAILADWFIQGTSRSDADEYQRGVRAYKTQQWHDAARLLAPLARKDYQQAKQYYDDAEDKVTDFDLAYKAAQSARFGDSPIRAALYYKNAYNIEPSYGDVGKLFTDTLKSAGQILYQDANGIYLADATGQPLAALPGSDQESRILAISDDHKMLCYTGKDISPTPSQGLNSAPSGTSNTLARNRSGNSRFSTSANIPYGGSSSAPARKVYVRNLLTSETESFDDVQSLPADGSRPVGLEAAVFFNSNKGLLLIKGGHSRSDTLQLFYFDIAANAALRNLGPVNAYASPASSDKYLYLAALPNSTTTKPTWYSNVDGLNKVDGSSLVVYDPATDKAKALAQADAPITQMAIAGGRSKNANDAALYFLSQRDASTSVYAIAPLASDVTKKLLTRTSQIAATPFEFPITTSPTSGEAFLLDRDLLRTGDGTDPVGAWLLQAASGKVTDLMDKGWGLVINTVVYVMYSHDGNKILVQGSMGQSADKVWRTVVNPNFDLNIRSDWLNQPFSYALWLDDAGNYFYTVSGDGFTVVDASEGKTLIQVAITNPLAATSETHVTLIAKNTLMYLANEGLYISDVDGRSPVFLIRNATAAWLIPPK